MTIDAGIRAIDGQFGSGKTLIMVRYIVQLYKDPRNIIYTNIKLHFTAPNILIVPDEIEIGTDPKTNKKKVKQAMLDVLQFVGSTDKKQRALLINRGDRLRHFCFFDEGGLLFNQHNRKHFPTSYYNYLLQVRKINVYLFLGVQLFKNLSTQLKEHIQSVFYFQPLFRLKFLKNYIGSVREKIVDVDGVTQTYVYLAKDDKGDVVKKEAPLDWFVEYIWKPSRYQFYDDLYLNKSFEEEVLYLDYSPIQPHIDNYFGKKKKTELGFVQKKLSDLKEYVDHDFDLFDVPYKFSHTLSSRMYYVINDYFVKKGDYRYQNSRSPIFHTDSSDPLYIRILSEIAELNYSYADYGVQHDDKYYAEFDQLYDKLVISINDLKTQEMSLSN